MRGREMHERIAARLRRRQRLHRRQACDDNNACTVDGCNPDAGCFHEGLDGTPCDADQNACTGEGDSGVDVCVAGECKPGALKADCAICRTAGFWGERGGTSHDTSGQLAGFNYTPAVIDAAIADQGCFSVCGQPVCGTDAVAGPGSLDGLGSALEALCIRADDLEPIDQTYRQTVAAALNCVLSGAYVSPAGCDAPPGTPPLFRAGRPLCPVVAVLVAG